MGIGPTHRYSRQRYFPKMRCGVCRTSAVVYRTVIAISYYAVWEQYRGLNDFNPLPIEGQAVNANGTVPVSTTQIFSDSGLALFATYRIQQRTEEFLVPGCTWPTPQYAYALLNCYALRLGGQRRQATAPQILISAPSQWRSGVHMASPAITYNSHRNEYLVVGPTTALVAIGIWAQRLNATGQLLDNAWTSADETNPANNFRISQPRGVRYNTIIHNTNNGIQLGGQAAASVNIVHNNLFDNGTYDIYLTGGAGGHTELHCQCG